MRVAIVPNTFRDTDLSVTKRVAGLLAAKNVRVLVDRTVASQFPAYRAFDKADMEKGIDILLTVGGDGTILAIVAEAARKNIPILGVNRGKVGFMTELEYGDLDAAAAERFVEDLKEKRYVIEKRTMLDVVVNGADRYLALNECVVNRGSACKMVTLEVFAGDAFLDAYSADGFLVSTPTGSTAYSLSAGGPILDPAIRGFALTAINPHSLRSRPVVLSDDIEVTIRIKDDKSPTLLVTDGNVVREISSRDLIKVRKSTTAARFVRLNPGNFYDRLQKKLNNWSMG